MKRERRPSYKCVCGKNEINVARDECVCARESKKRVYIRRKKKPPQQNIITLVLVARTREKEKRKVLQAYMIPFSLTSSLDNIFFFFLHF